MGNDQADRSRPTPVRARPDTSTADEPTPSATIAYRGRHASATPAPLIGSVTLPTPTAAPSATPTATATGDAAEVTITSVAVRPGRRRATTPAARGRRIADPETLTSTIAPRTVPAPRSGPKRRAERRRPRLPLPAVGSLAPALPRLLGAAVILVAAGGVVVTGGDATAARPGLELAATSPIAEGFAPHKRANRERALSRDSRRQALQNIVDQDLKAATEQQSQMRNVKLASLAASAEERADQIAQNLWVIPTYGYRLTAQFGMGGGLWSRGHTGMDFATRYGTPIVAVASGVVTKTGYEGAYGNKTVITHDDGTEVWYAHQSSIGVRVGDRVTQGQQIGQVGSTGNSTGAHLHIEVRPGGGDPVDPYAAFLHHGVTP